MSTKIYDVYITDKPLFDVFKMLGELHIKHSDDEYQEVVDEFYSQREPLEVSVAVIPLSRRRTIVKPFYSDLEKSEAAKDLKALIEAEFSDYHYQNQSDRPDEISPQEWNARRLNWDRLSDSYGLSYTDMGMVYSIWKPREVVKRVRNF